MRGTQSYVGPFTGGLNLRDPAIELSPTETNDCLNVITTPRGGIIKREPCTLLSNTFTGAGSNNISSLYPLSAVNNVLIATAGTKMYSVNTSNGTATDITGAASIPSNGRWSFVEGPATGQGPFFGLPSDLSTVPKQWSGSGNIADWTATSGTLTKGDFMVFYKNRIVMGGTLLSNGIKASAVGDAQNWDTTSTAADSAWSVQIDPSDGQVVTALAPYQSYLIVFKPTKIYVVYDMNTGANRQINSGVGTINRRTVVTTPYGVFFLANDGHVYVCDGTKVEKISDVLNPASYFGGINNINGLGYYFTTQDLNLNAVYYRNWYYLSTSQGTYAYNIRDKAWFLHSPITTQFAVANWDNAASQLFAGIKNTSPAPVIWRMFDPLDPNTGLFKDGTNRSSGAGGTTYNSYWTTPPINPVGKGQNLHIRRRYHAMRVYTAGTVDIQLNLDATNSSSSFTTKASLVGTQGDVQEHTLYSLGVARALAIKFNQTGSALSFEVEPPVLYSQPRTD